MIGASNSWCLAYDNLSHLPAWQSDALCRISTGGGLATRELFTDQDETIFDVQRPVILNGIEEIVTRTTCSTAASCKYLPASRQTARKPETQYWPSSSDAPPAHPGRHSECREHGAARTRRR